MSYRSFRCLSGIQQSQDGVPVPKKQPRLNSLPQGPSGIEGVKRGSLQRIEEKAPSLQGGDESDSKATTVGIEPPNSPSSGNHNG